MEWKRWPVDLVVAGDYVQLGTGETQFRVGQVSDQGTGLIRLYPVGDKLPWYVANGRPIWVWK